MTAGSASSPQRCAGATLGTITQVDEAACSVTMVQAPLDPGLPVTRIERRFTEEAVLVTMAMRRFTEDGMLVTMVCEEVVATSEFTRCIQDDCVI